MSYRLCINRDEIALMFSSHIDSWSWFRDVDIAKSTKLDFANSLNSLFVFAIFFASFFFQFAITTSHCCNVSFIMTMSCNSKFWVSKTCFWHDSTRFWCFHHDVSFTHVKEIFEMKSFSTTRWVIFNLIIHEMINSYII